MSKEVKDIPLSEYTYEGEGDDLLTNSQKRLFVRKLLFKKGQPYLYGKDGKRFVEYPDGSTKRIR